MQTPRGQERLGPGTYNCGHLTDISASTTSEPRGTSAFRSSAKLGAHVRRTDAPPATLYQPRQNSQGREWAMVKSSTNYSNKGAHMFAGTTRQHMGLPMSKSTGALVGPTTYDLTSDGDGRGSMQAKAAQRVNKKPPGFGSSSPARKAWYE